MEKLLIDYDQVFFIFDRYNSDSIKGEERLVRSKGVTRTYVLSPGVEMPAQKIVTSVTRLDLLDLWRLQGPSVNSSPPQASVVHKPTNFIHTVKLGVFPECVYIG